ncbi:MAG: sugar ABC transporter ATP-binding protein [Actinomycetota bacterium]|nr:sugar ABC transporter ATP-binding protein [Actinomycetota bacterium]
MPVVDCRGVSKWYGTAKVLDDVDFSVNEGEIHVLLGENGAGKSTLVKIVAGLVSPDRGEVSISGTELRYGSVVAAQSMGVALIHQEPRLFPDLTVMENVWIDQRSGAVGKQRFRLSQMGSRTKELLAQLGSSVSPDARVAFLSVADQQMVDIAAALRRDLKVLIVDEPTASLTPSEVTNLFRVMRDLKDQGVAIIFIGHRLEEILEISDRITVLRDGKLVTTVNRSDANEDELIRLMIGRDIDTGERRDSANVGDVLLTVANLSEAGRFSDVSLNVRQGEIVGIGGLVGAGRSELLETIFGVRAKSAGTIDVGGADISSISDAVSAGMGLVPEDRGRYGLILLTSVLNNISAPNLDLTSWHDVRSPRKELRNAESIVSRLRIKVSNVQQLAGQLSGGNQQRVSLGKWLVRDLEVLLVDEPTRGVDIGSKVEIHALLREFADSGKAVVMVSSDMRELLEVPDRILIMREGRLAGELSREEATEEAVMRLASGVAA